MGIAHTEACPHLPGMLRVQGPVLSPVGPRVQSGVGAQAPAQQAGGAQARPSQRTLPLAPADSPGEPSAGAGGGPGAGAGAGAGAGPQQQAAAGAVGASEAAELAEKRKVLGATLDECVSLFVSQVRVLADPTPAPSPRARLLPTARAAAGMRFQDAVQCSSLQAWRPRRASQLDVL